MQPVKDNKPWVQLVFLDTVGREPIIGRLIGETDDTYALKDTTCITERPNGVMVREIQETNVCFYQKHAVFCMELVNIRLGKLTDEEAVDL
jgi:hypothetical protein